MSAPLLSIRNLHKSFGQIEVLKGIDLDIAKGETVVLVGASGSGKSTLLRCLNFLEIPTSGSITFDGKTAGSAGATEDQRRYTERELRPLRARIGMVFQQFNLFPHMTVTENIMEAQRSVLGRSAPEARARALDLLERIGLSERRDYYPSQLSGGQQQRVAICRSLAMDPEVMLFDEATSALDPELVGEVLRAMRGLRDQGMTMIIVTHELGFAWHIADRVAFLSEGRIHEIGTPDEVLVHPRLARTQQFVAGHGEFRLPEGQD